MMIQSELRPVEILLVEDNLGDVRLAREWLRESRITNELNFVTDGVEAMAYLRREGRFQGVSRPDLILLDLNLPKKNGQEVLAEIKKDPDLHRIPVVVLTSSKAEEDIVKAYSSYANCYVTKPLELSQFMKVVKAIEDFWFTIARLPG